MFIRGWILLLSTMAPAILAQPIPKLTSISPEWIQRGTTVEIVLTGENLGAVTGFIFSGDPGLSATNVPLPAPPQPAITIESSGGGISSAAPPPTRDEKRLVAKVTATADATFTAREMRVVSPGGVSNPLQLNAGQWPEVREKEPNNSIEQAQLVTLPAAISGVISAASQVDYYRFKAGKGQELVFDVDAAVRGSALDSSLAILNAAGKELARNEDNNGLDSLLMFTVPEDGEYLVQLRDFRYQGGGTFNYRLYAGPLPYVDLIFPFGGQRGKPVEIALTGRNLAGTTKMTLNIAPTAPLGRQEIRATTPNGYSNLVPFDVSDLPDLLETEPNNTADKANAITLPVVINGRVGEPKDIDRFKFKSDKDQKLVCEVAASRFGSKLDALLILTDASGAMLQQNDDANGADARIEFDAKKDAEYIIALRDLTERGGERFGYRLSIRPPGGGGGAGPDFSAVFLPDTIRVHREGQTKLRCEVNRVGGFEGPVRFAFAELPAGVFAEPLVLSSAPASGILLVSALKDAPLGSFPVLLTASGTIGGKSVTRTATPISGAAGVRQAFLTVLDTTPFTLEATTLSASVEQNQSATIEVMVQRRDGFTGDVKLSAEGFSAGREAITKSFEVGEITVKGSESIGKLTFKAKLDS
ncbi:MAG TPA: PPC domain-containing protein, partial [Verrucomicrobiae bacterium]